MEGIWMDSDSLKWTNGGKSKYTFAGGQGNVEIPKNMAGPGNYLFYFHFCRGSYPFPFSFPFVRLSV